jgi:hypothetical protein
MFVDLFATHPQSLKWPFGFFLSAVSATLNFMSVVSSHTSQVSHAKGHMVLTSEKLHLCLGEFSVNLQYLFCTSRSIGWKILNLSGESTHTAVGATVGATVVAATVGATVVAATVGAAVVTAAVGAIVGAPVVGAEVVGAMVGAFVAVVGGLETVGASVGAIVGDAEGSPDGAFDGINEGAFDGLVLGSPLGALLGAPLGVKDGTSEATRLGAIL